jgi:hypothetical protein
MSDATDLISGDALKASAQRFLAEVRAKVDQEQGGLLSIFDSWFSRVLTKLSSLDREQPWEDSVKAHAAGMSGPAQDLAWDLSRLRLFLDRWEQGRFVELSRRERSATHYHSRFGTEFGADVLLTCQGAPSLMRWRGKPLMKNVFDFAIYPALIAELRKIPDSWSTAARDLRNRFGLGRERRVVRRSADAEQRGRSRSFRRHRRRADAAPARSFLQRRLLKSG